MQIDNQMPAPVFPTVLATVPLPKSVAAESGKKLISSADVRVIFYFLSSATKPLIEFSR